jgi:hypothetical protein
MPSEPTDESATGQPQPRRSGRSLDAEVVRAAVDRMEAAIGREHSTVDRLRTELAALQQTLAQAKIAVQQDAVKPAAKIEGTVFDVAALLDELVHRVDAMLEIGGGRGRKEMTRDERPSIPEPDRVPTVSGVVLRLGREGDDAKETAPAVGGDGERDASSTSMLEAMVLALSVLDILNPREAARHPAGQDERHAPPANQSAQTGGGAHRPMPAKAILPENELTAAVARPDAFWTSPPGPAAGLSPVVEPHKPGDKPPTIACPDPLAPLQAMTAAEKIALFS